MASESGSKKWTLKSQMAFMELDFEADKSRMKAEFKVIMAQL